jgi:hypothetical protein
MDAGTFGKLKRGQARPEARIDLHGMTLAQAHPALIGFHPERARGRASGWCWSSPARGGPTIIDAPMPGARRAAAARRAALAVAAAPGGRGAPGRPAHRRHGGEGALYVYLRAP